MKNNLMTRKNIDVSENNYIPVANFKQEDDGVIKLALFANSTKLDCTGQSAKLYAKRPDGAIIELTTGCSIKGNEIDITLKNNILAVAGIVECDLELIDGQGKMTTASFYVGVFKKMAGIENIEANNDISAINKIVEEVLAKGEKLNGQIDKIVAEANGKIAEIDKALKDKLDEMQADYDSLQKIIIDENQAANLQSQINTTNAQLETIIQDDSVSSKSAWSSQKAIEQINLIPKGEKGDAGTASVSIDDTKINTNQTWTSSKIKNEISDITLSTLNNGSITENVFTEYSAIGTGQLILMYDIGTITRDTIFDFKSVIYSKNNIGNISINIFANNDPVIGSIGGGYSYTNLDPKSYKQNKAVDLETTFIAKANHRYVRIMIKIESVNPNFYIVDRLMSNNNIYKNIGSDGFNLTIVDKTVDNTLPIQLLKKGELLLELQNTRYFEEKFRDSKKYKNDVGKILITSNPNTSIAKNKAFFILGFTIGEEKVFLDNSNEILLSLHDDISYRELANNLTVQVYSSPTDAIYDLSNATLIGALLENKINENSIDFSHTFKNINLKNSSYIKVLIGVEFANDLNDTVKNTISNLELKLNNVYMKCFGAESYINSGNTIIEDDILSYARLKDLNELKASMEQQNKSMWLDKNLLSFGDSITWQDGHKWLYYDKVGQIAKGYQGNAKDILGLKHIVNYGVSNTTLANVGAGDGSMWNTYFSNGCTNLLDIDIVTIAHGTNDYASDVSIGQLGKIDDTQYDVTTYYGAYRDILDKIIKNYPKIRIVLCTPIQKRTIAPNGKGHTLNDYRNAVIEVARLYSLPVCDFYSLAGLNYLNHLTYFPDGVHPNEDGHALMGRRYASVINQI